MFRLSIMTLYLCLISAIALTLDPLKGSAFQWYNLFSAIGTSPSFTPITTDMLMMTRQDGENDISKTLQLMVYQDDQSWRVILPKQLDLYRHKIPIILLLKHAVEKIDLVEARFALCQQLGELVGFEVQSFAITEGQIQKSDFLNQKEFLCDFASTE